MTKEEANREREITIGHLHERKYLVYGTVLFKDYVRHWLEDIIKTESAATIHTIIITL